MTASELIERLQCYQPDAELFVITEDGPEPVEYIEARSYDPNDAPILWLCHGPIPEPITSAIFDPFAELEEVPF